MGNPKEKIPFADEDPFSFLNVRQKGGERRQVLPGGKGACNGQEGSI
jgi:hypothetical protein